MSGLKEHSFNNSLHSRYTTPVTITPLDVPLLQQLQNLSIYKDEAVVIKHVFIIGMSETLDGFFNIDMAKYNDLQYDLLQHTYYSPLLALLDYEKVISGRNRFVIPGKKVENFYQFCIFSLGCRLFLGTTSFVLLI